MNANIADLLVERVQVRMKLVAIKCLEVVVACHLKQFKRLILAALRKILDGEEHLGPVDRLVRVGQTVFHADLFHLLHHSLDLRRRRLRLCTFVIVSMLQLEKQRFDQEE